MALTDRQQQILTFIATYKARHGAPRRSARSPGT